MKIWISKVSKKFSSCWRGELTQLWFLAFMSVQFFFLNIWRAHCPWKQLTFSLKTTIKNHIFTLGLLTDHVCHGFLALTEYCSSVYKSYNVEYILIRSHDDWAYSDIQVKKYLKRQHLILHEFLWRLNRHIFLGYGRKLSSNFIGQFIN